MPSSADPSRPPRGATLLLGLALGGFFDGILLHQVLQWHHLLSKVEAVRELRWQLLADGLFHLLMYALALAALARLWRRRAHLGAGGPLLAAALAGFAGWHVLDALLSHWILGIHRIRVGVPDPLFWDLLWLGLFGGLPLMAACWLHRRPSGGSGAGAATALGVVAVAAGAASLLPLSRPPAGSVVVFAPGIPPAHAYQALARLDARVRWVDPAGSVWSVEWSGTPGAWQLLREGALLAGGSPLAFGCIAAAGPSPR